MATYNQLIASIEEMIDRHVDKDGTKRDAVTKKVFSNLRPFVNEMKLPLNDYRVLLYYFSVEPDEPYKSALEKLKKEILEQNGMSSYIAESMKNGMSHEDARKNIVKSFVSGYLDNKIPFETLETALWSLDILLLKKYYVMDDKERRKEISNSDLDVL